jgi:hypothetical protein
MHLIVFACAHTSFKIPEGRTLLALGRRGSNAQSHFPSPAPTQNSEVELCGIQSGVECGILRERL